ncbi:hypothetical protein B0T21DRAFT_288423 [Apiosordaria backusii]|uniref:Microbial-type PARG catalytic domain-containing protein n=1 Tax=Apiosordaria backusii TaxID=314023 RepID=A0AA40ECU7_9PEZI|nr:hypothetical protein B0T21DRAFT_288423 [Apiosordaria backusii]
MPGNSQPSRGLLRATGNETRRLLPNILRELNTTHLATFSMKKNLLDLAPLEPDNCPRFPNHAEIQVIHEETLTTALRLHPPPLNHPSNHYMPTNPSLYGNRQPNWLPLVANFTSPPDNQPGGGWRSGTLGHEEALCYRSSLPLSLHQHNRYPLEEKSAIYSPYILVIKDSLANNHIPFNISQPATLPVVSAITIAPLRHPALGPGYLPCAEGQAADDTLPFCNQAGEIVLHVPMRQTTVFGDAMERMITMQKMRLVLRMAATNRHPRIVLGAMGCGRDNGPVEDVALCWLEVLREEEFQGGWWTDVVFAVWDEAPINSRANYEIFQRVLQGKRV